MSRALLFLSVIAAVSPASLEAQVMQARPPLDIQLSGVEQGLMVPISASSFLDEGPAPGPCDSAGCDGAGCDGQGETPGCQCAACQWRNREHFLGDWGGLRTTLAEHGIVADLQFTQFYQGVTSGGQDREMQYGGKLDYMFTFLGGKLGLNEGFKSIVHAETRYGEGIDGNAGPFAFPNSNMLFPLPGQNDTAITGLLFMQALNERIALAAGKINVVDLWTMLYPHVGRGVEGFMNLNALSVGLPWLRFVNLSVMGAGALVLEGEQIQGGVLVFDTNNSTTSTGFHDLFDQGAAVLGLWRFFTDWNGKPGSHLFAGGWSSRKYTSVDPTSLTVIPGQGLTLGQETGAWAFAYYFDQIIWADRCNDKRNIRLFSGWTISDGNPSPARWAGMASLQGTGLIPRREQDRMGVAYFYNGLSDDFRRLTSVVVDLEELQGVELYYNVAVRPWCHVTADLQIIDNAREQDGTAVVFGLRTNIDL